MKNTILTMVADRLSELKSFSSNSTENKINNSVHNQPIVLHFKLLQRLFKSRTTRKKVNINNTERVIPA